MHATRYACYLPRHPSGLILGEDLCTLVLTHRWTAYVLCVTSQVFVTSRKLSSEAVVGLMGALYEVSRLTLSDSWRAFQHKSQLDMLKQALQVLKVNLHLTQASVSMRGTHTRHSCTKCC